MTLGELPPHPVDRLGVPFALHPNLPVGSPNNVQTNLHHSYFFAKDPYYQTPEGIALRSSRVQRVFVPAHDRLTVTMGAPPIPTTTQQADMLICLNIARYVPGQAINVATPEPEPVEISPERRDMLRSQFGTEAQQRPKVERFQDTLPNYFMGRLIDVFKDTDPEAFSRIDFVANTLKERKQFREARRIVNKALPKLAEPIQPAYKKARRRGAIDRNEPSHVEEIIMDQISFGGNMHFVAQKAVALCITDSHNRFKQARREGSR